MNKCTERELSFRREAPKIHSNRWTLALAGAGVISFGALVQAEEAKSQVLTALSQTTLSGYVSTSGIWKPGTSNAGIPGRAFDAAASKHDGFNLDVVSLTVAKPLSEGEWSAGYTAQLWFGPDAVAFNTSAPNLAGAGGDLAVKQAYVELGVPIGNGLNFKIGHFNYIGGYEVPDSGDDLNYSRSYAWTLEPASHTGILASYKVSDELTLATGVANSYNNGVNWRAARLGGPVAESEKTYMGQFILTAPEGFGCLKGATLSGTVVTGLNNPSGSGGSALSAGHFTCYQIGGTVPTPLEGLVIGASYDYMDAAPLGFAPAPNKSAYANAATLYTSYRATEKLRLNARGEYTSATGGFWYAPGPSGGEELLGITGTIDYSLWANVVSRLECRWDHSLTGDRPFGGTAAAPGGDKNVVTVAANIIYKF
ncbi:MAG: outer membrane beta-barrel protein [Verrucomicrobia bacterium]|nr:outer membrane beta-barrel protein [Verrucomicrobiota bacterium]